METIKSNRLVFTAGSSDKEYNLQLVKDKSLYFVNFQYGRRNGTLNSGTKTDEPVTIEEAEKIFQKLLKEKVGKGYIPDGESKSDYIPVEKESTGEIPQLLNVVAEQELESLITDDNYVFQKKYDGERRMVFKNETDCFGGNKNGSKVSLPSLIIKSFKNVSLVTADGELIGETIFLFDLLSLNGVNYKNESYAKRLAQLEKCKFGANVVVVETAKTTKEKRAMLAALKADKSEGITVKDLRAKHTPSRPSSGGPALKFKFYKTATVKVSEITKGKRSIQVSVLSNGAFLDVGAVTIPPNKEIPKVGEFVEVRYLYAYKGGSLYQPTYLNPRTDVDDDDASITQLEYKQGQDD